LRFVFLLLAAVSGALVFGNDESSTKLWRSPKDTSFYIRYPSCWKDTLGVRNYGSVENIDFAPTDKCPGFKEEQWKISIGVDGIWFSSPPVGVLYKGSLPAGVSLRREDSPASSGWRAKIDCARGAVFVNFSGNFALDLAESRNRAVPPRTMLEFLRGAGCAMRTRSSSAREGHSAFRRYRQNPSAFASMLIRPALARQAPRS
jgi:hypothetical protein